MEKILPLLLVQIVKLIQSYSILHVLKMDIGMCHQIVIPMEVLVQMDSFLLFLRSHRNDYFKGYVKVPIQFVGPPAPRI